MSDRFIIPLPGLGTLELPREAFDQYLKAAQHPVAPKQQADVVDAEDLARRTGVPASWWLSQARERRVPTRKFGRYVRFEMGEVMQCEAFRREVIDDASDLS